MLRSDASLVEVDFLRAGARMLALPSTEIPAMHRTDYLACVSLGWRHTRRMLYPMPLRERLPTLPIPLRESEAVVDEIYTRGRYTNLDYTQELEPPLSAEEVAWAKSHLKAAGRS